MRRLGLAALVLLIGQVAWAGGPLANPGFESKLEGWSWHVYGAAAAAEFDEQVTHGGAQSLRVSSTQPSDAALGQEITLSPSRWYRFSGWVRTRGLDPGTAPTCGTFQIQFPGGARVLAGGANHRGDTEWTLVPIVFESPADGRVRVAPFFVGYGEGTGTAWFDDIAIEPIDVNLAPVRITRKPLVAGSLAIRSASLRLRRRCAFDRRGSRIASRACH